MVMAVWYYMHKYFWASQGTQVFSDATQSAAQKRQRRAVDHLTHSAHGRQGRNLTGSLHTEEHSGAREIERPPKGTANVGGFYVLHHDVVL